jgi:hypothetical protein
MNFVDNKKTINSDSSNSNESFQSCISINNKCGYLWKKSYLLNKWHKRWFEIHDGYLLYFKTNQTIKIKDCIDLRKSLTIQILADSSIFHIDTEDLKYIIKASSLNECQEWVTALQKIRDSYINNRNQKPIMIEMNNNLFQNRNYCCEKESYDKIHNNYTTSICENNVEDPRILYIRKIFWCFNCFD